MQPDVPIIALTPSEVAYRRMALVGYVYPVMFDFKSTVDETLAEAEKIIAKKGFLAPGDSVLVCAGFIDKLPGYYSFELAYILFIIYFRICVNVFFFAESFYLPFFSFSSFCFRSHQHHQSVQFWRNFSKVNNL